MLLLSFSLSVLSAASSATVADGTLVTAQEFLGFSADEQYAAWAADLRRDTDDYSDTYRLHIVVDTRTDEVVSTFQASDLRRTAKDGLARRYRARRVAADNQAWADAKSQLQWDRFERMVAFAVPEVEPELTDVIRVTAGGRVYRDSHGFRIEGARKVPVAYALAVRLTGGGEARLADVTTGSPSAQVTLYLSPSGHHVAILSAQATAPGAETPAEPIGMIRRFEAQRVATRHHLENPDTSSVPRLFYAQRTPRWVASQQNGAPW